MKTETTITICGLCKKREIENNEVNCFICDERLHEAQQEAQEEREEQERLQNGY